jgi:glycosyltransferase involved in cell wall biosynthesis
MHAMIKAVPLFLARGGAIDGQQRQVLYLATALAKQQLPPVVVLDSDGPLFEELTGAGIEVHCAKMSSWRAPARLIQRYLDAFRFLKIASPHKIGVVHVHDMWRAAYARFLARRLDVPYVVHVRGPVDVRDVGKYRLAQANAVVAIAQRYIDDLAAAGVGRERIRLIDDAVDASFFDPAAEGCSAAAVPRAADAVPVIGFVGRITPVKLVCEFLDIVAKLSAFTMLRPRVLIAGEWSDRAYAHMVRATVSRLGLGDRVEFTGRLPSRKVPHLLASIDLLVTLSGGSVMFETMAMAKPVLSLRADGRHSLHTRHGETAWCVDTIDAAACARELARLLEDQPLRQRLGETARTRVVAHLSIDEMAAKTIILYDELARAAARGDQRAF